MLVGTSDLYHFMQLVVVTSSLGSKTFWLIFLHTAQLIWMKFGVAFKLFELNTLYYFRALEVCVIEENNCSFAYCSKEL